MKKHFRFVLVSALMCLGACGYKPEGSKGTIFVQCFETGRITSGTDAGEELEAGFRYYELDLNRGRYKKSKGYRTPPDLQLGLEVDGAWATSGNFDPDGYSNIESGAGPYLCLDDHWQGCLEQMNLNEGVQSRTGKSTISGVPSIEVFQSSKCSAVSFFGWQNRSLLNTRLP